MRKRIQLSLLVALILAVGSVAPLVAISADLSHEGVAAVAVSAPADAGADAKPKGNGFVRAITAPFRALGRLFGGGKKRDEAKNKERKEQTGARVEALIAAAPPRPEKVKEEKRREQAAKRKAAPDTAVVREVKSVPATAAASPAQGDAASAVALSPAAETRVVRPSEGQPAQPVSPKWIPVIEGIDRDPLTQGRALLQHGYPNEAISELSIAAATGTDLVEANNLLGLAYDRVGLHNQAIGAYERALTAAPDSAQVLNNLGHSLFLDNRHAEALKRLKQADRLVPGSPHILQNIAVVQARLGKYGDAFKTFARAFGEYNARLKTAELLEQAGRADDALKHYESALKLQPNSPALLERLLAIYEQKGRTRDAEAARRALGNPPNKQKTTTGGG